MPADQAPRVFLACWPDASLRDHLARVQALPGWRGRPVPAENWHLTLVFIGAVPAPSLPALAELAAAVRLPGHPLLLDRVGWFRRAGVGWLGGPDVPPGGWSDRVGDLRRAVRALGYPVEQRPWRPHLTLYRGMRKPPGTMSIEPWSWQPEAARLVVSETTPDGVRYRDWEAGP